MKKRALLALLTAVPVAGPAPGADAHPNLHYDGGCMFWGVSDGTDDAQTQWNGEIRIVATATDTITGLPAPTAQISVECELRINGSTPGTVVFAANGIGAAVGANPQFSYNADPDDWVTMCDIVTVDNEIHKNCRDATVASFVPEPVEELLHTVLDENPLSEPVCEHASELLCENGDPLHPEALHTFLCILGPDLI